MRSASGDRGVFYEEMICDGAGCLLPRGEIPSLQRDALFAEGGPCLIATDSLHRRVRRFICAGDGDGRVPKNVYNSRFPVRGISPSSGAFLPDASFADEGMNLMATNSLYHRFPGLIRADWHRDGPIPKKRSQQPFLGPGDLFRQLHVAVMHPAEFADKKIYLLGANFSRQWNREFSRALIGTRRSPLRKNTVQTAVFRPGRFIPAASCRRSAPSRFCGGFR